MADDKRNGLLYVACRRGRPDKLLSPTELRQYMDNHVQCNGAPWFDWQIVSSQKDALRALRPNLPHLALVEIDIDQQRMHFCTALRERAPSVKIVAMGVTQLFTSHSADVVLCLPLDAKQVTNTVAGLLDSCSGGLMQVGTLILNVDTCTIVTPKGQYHMTPKSVALLYYMMTHHDQVLSRSELMQNVWDTTFLGDTRTLDVHIRWLRERIEDDPSEPKLLTTVRGRGYRLAV
jgi:DNA-binding response OmpR family regulator